MRQYLLVGTAVLALIALAAPARAHDGSGSRRYRSGVVRRYSSRPAVYGSYGRRYSRPVIYRTRGRRVYTVNRGYRHDRLHDRLERRHERAHIRGFRSRAAHRRFHVRQQRAHERAHRLRTRRVGWGSYDY